MAPEWAVTPLAVLATMATVIASQALISGAFSLTAQAVQLDYLPRLDIRHTSTTQIGQIYVPLVNWLLMIGCVGLVLGFRTSSNLAAAYGIAVTATMAITTLLFYRVVVDRWRWSDAQGAGRHASRCFVVDLAFFAANVPKIPDGGWFPLVVGLGLVVQMTTWRRGRAIVARILAARAPPDRRRRRRGARRRGDPGAGHGDLHVQGSRLRAAGADLQPAPQPRPARDDDRAVGRHRRRAHGSSRRPIVGHRPRCGGVYQVVLTFGYMDTHDVIGELRQLRAARRAAIDLDDVTFFLGRETVASIPKGEMPRWREHLFVVLNRGAASASRFYHLPRQQVFEVGTQVEI